MGLTDSSVTDLTPVELDLDSRTVAIVFVKAAGCVVDMEVAGVVNK